MKIERYKIKKWPDKETGLLVSENKDWVLVKHIPADYVVDGYKLYNKHFIKSREACNNEKIIHRVLKLKGIKDDAPKNFRLGTTVSLIKWIEKQFGLFEFQLKKETEVYYGKLKSATNGTMRLDGIEEDGEVVLDEDFKYDASKIRALSFGSDYFESIRLLMIDTNK